MNSAGALQHCAMEATTLQVKDILSDRKLVHIHAGKGALDRTVPLPEITLLALRKYYKTHHNPKWIFTALGCTPAIYAVSLR